MELSATCFTGRCLEQDDLWVLCLPRPFPEFTLEKWSFYPFFQVPKHSRCGGICELLRLSRCSGETQPGPGKDKSGSGLGLSRTAPATPETFPLIAEGVWIWVNSCMGGCGVFSFLHSLQTSLHFLSTVPEIPPSEVSGGGGSRSELVITWDVSLLGRSLLHRTSFFLSALSECPWLQQLLLCPCVMWALHIALGSVTVPVLDGNPQGVQFGWDCFWSQTNINA